MKQLKQRNLLRHIQNIIVWTSKIIRLTMEFSGLQYE